MPMPVLTTTTRSCATTSRKACKRPRRSCATESASPRWSHRHRQGPQGPQAL